MYFYIAIGLFCFWAGIVTEHSTEIERQRRGSYRPQLLIEH
jgi:hypothetical protein